MIKQDREPIIIGDFAFVKLSAGKVAKIDAKNVDKVAGRTWTTLKRRNTDYAGNLSWPGNEWIMMHKLIMGVREKAILQF